MVGSRNWEGKIQHVPGIFDVPESEVVFKHHGVAGSYLKEFPMSKYMTT